jgi:hypothetical protein
MVAGSGLGSMVTVLLPLVGIVAMIRGHIRRTSGKPEPVDDALEKRRDATRESERRMQAYLAQSRPGGHQAYDSEGDIRR